MSPTSPNPVQADPPAVHWLEHIGHYVAIAGLAGTALAVVKWLFTPIAIQIARKLLQSELASLDLLSARLGKQTSDFSTELNRLEVLAEQLEKRIDIHEHRLNHSSSHHR